MITLTGKEAQPEVAVTLSDAWAQWRDAVMLRNYGKNGSTIIAVKDPEQLRSIFARFDNARRGLPGASSGHRSRPCDLQATGGLRG